ncbi:MAG: hypothetical protein ACRESF_12000 [Pseudomonas sp.]
MSTAQFKGNFRRIDSRLADWHDQLETRLATIETQVGGVPQGLVDNPVLVNQGVAPPPAASFNVTGIDGKFITIVNNPQTVVPQSVLTAKLRFHAGMNLQRTAILHNLQSATDLNFNQASSLKDYGTGPQLLWTDQDPNVIRFFRLRSSYDGVTWNAWQVFSSPLTCGPVGVSSGLLRTAALTPVNGAYTPTTQPLTATTGVSVDDATINVASFQVQYPNSIAPASNGIVSYNSGAITGLLDSTLYYVYCLDNSYSGGAQTYFATPDNPDVNVSDFTVYLGTITTPVHGGGGTGGNGGGNGPCFLETTAIITKRGIRLIAKIQPGDEVLTQRGWRKVRGLIVHSYSGPIYRMPLGGHVTPDHRFWSGTSDEWLPAKDFFAFAFEFAGSVYNLEIDGDGSDQEQCYTLANGWIAHNVQKA